MQKNDLLASLNNANSAQQKPKQTLLPIQIPDYKRIFSPNRRSKNPSALSHEKKSKEQMSEEILQLKNKLNDQQREISTLKSEVIKKETESSKKEKLFEKFFNGLTSANNSNFNSNNNNNLLSCKSSEESKAFEQVKIYQSNKFIKDQYKKLKEDFKEKCLEAERLKKSAKLTKQAELNIEIFTLNDEFAKLKAKYLQLYKENEALKARAKNLEKMDENFSAVQSENKALYDKLSGAELEKSAMLEALKELNQQAFDKETRIVKLSTDYKAVCESNKRLFPLRRINEEYEKSVLKLQKQLVDMQKQVFFYKDVAEKKDKVIKEFEKAVAAKTKDFLRECRYNKSLVKKFSNFGLGYDNNNNNNNSNDKNNYVNYQKSGFNFGNYLSNNKNKNDIYNVIVSNSGVNLNQNFRFIQENPENKYSNFEAHLRNRLNLVYRNFQKAYNSKQFLSAKCEYLEVELANIISKYNGSIEYSYKPFEEVQEKFKIEYLKVFNESEINSLLNIGSSSADIENTNREFNGMEVENNNEYSDQMQKIGIENFSNMNNNEEKKNEDVNENEKDMNAKKTCNALELIEEFNTENLHPDYSGDTNVNNANYNITNWENNQNKIAPQAAKSSSLTFEDFSYILVKNFEGRRINVNAAIKDLVDAIMLLDKNRIKENNNNNNQEEKSDAKQHEAEHNELEIVLNSIEHLKIIEVVESKLIEMLNLRNEEDKGKVDIFLKELYERCNRNVSSMIEQFISLVSSARIYNEEEEKIFSEKLIKSLSDKLGIFKQLLCEVDAKNKQFINFINLRIILDNIQSDLNEESAEFLIYYLKKFDDGTHFLEDLKYTNLIEEIEEYNKKDHKFIHLNHIKSAINPESEAFQENNLNNENNNNNKSQTNQNENSKIITNEILNERIERIFSHLRIYLISKNLSAKEFFKNYSFKPVFEDYAFDCTDEAIFLKIFADEMEKIGFILDGIDMQCVFLKLKILDDYDALSVNVIESLVGDFLKDNETNKSEISKNNNDYDNENNNYYCNNDSKADETQIKNKSKIDKNHDEVEIKNKNNQDNNTDKEEKTENKIDNLNVSQKIKVTENFKIEEKYVHKNLEIEKPLGESEAEKPENKKIKDINNSKNLGLEINNISKISAAMENNLVKDLDATKIKMSENSVIMRTLNMSVKNKNEKTILLNDLVNKTNDENIEQADNKSILKEVLVTRNSNRSLAEKAINGQSISRNQTPLKALNNMDISKESIKINDLNISKQITKQNEEQKIEKEIKQETLERNDLGFDNVCVKNQLTKDDFFTKSNDNPADLIIENQQENEKEQEDNIVNMSLSVKSHM